MNKFLENWIVDRIDQFRDETPDILAQFYQLLIDKTGEDTVKNGSTNIEDNYLTFRDANGIVRGKINLLGGL